MRRRPQRLQVTTFPFLAVLLCAMGSLILLLLVIDRRAKRVARHKALEARAAQQAEKAKKWDLCKDDWERQRQALHAELAKQFQELQAQVRQIEEQAAIAHGNLDYEKTQVRALDNNLGQAKNRLAQERAVQAARQASLGQTASHQTVARAELDRLARELEQLEQTLQALRLLRQRDHQTYSLVPYKGRRGDLRRPIYIECNAAGVVLHPQQRALSGEDGLAIRQAVLQHLGQRSDGNEGPEKNREYLLLLVRPDGIPNYYRAQAALRGLKLDFGYEMIDRDWILDFSSDERAGQPWRVARSPDFKPAPLDAGLGPKVQPYRPSERVPQGSDEKPSLDTAGNNRGSGPTTSPQGPTPPSLGMRSPSLGVVGNGNPALPVPAQNLPGTPSILAQMLPSLSQGQLNPGSGIFRPSQGNAPPPGTDPVNLGAPGAPLSSVPGNKQAPGNPGSPGDEEGPGIRPRPPLPFDQATKPPSPPPLPLSRLLGNRDYLIVLECTADAVIVHPGGHAFDTAALPGRADPYQDLVQTIQQLIARRQASVQPGEPPYRPLLRFQIHSDGLRSYYRAYPLLEGLRLPMTRENVD